VDSFGPGSSFSSRFLVFQFCTRSSMASGICQQRGPLSLPAPSAQCNWHQLGVVVVCSSVCFLSYTARANKPFCIGADYLTVLVSDTTDHHTQCGWQ
jgi:hypothetical protein